MNNEYFNGLSERRYHSDTTVALTPLEREHLADYEKHYLPSLAAVEKAENALSALDLKHGEN